MQQIEHEYKKVKLVLLPTDEVAPILSYMYDTPVGAASGYTSERLNMNTYVEHKSYHLYAVQTNNDVDINDKIYCHGLGSNKVGYCKDIINGQVFVSDIQGGVPTVNYYIDSCHKILATTDKRFDKINKGLDRSKDIIFPKLSKEFIKLFIGRGGIDNALVVCKPNGPIIIDTDNEVFIRTSKQLWNVNEVEALLKKAIERTTSSFTSEDLKWVKEQLLDN